uniref:FBA_2 domain-containing protein n=1 Tax=Steinernema glaseri TaxID=37863 RepID=A0A1I7XY64_9BILA
METFRNLGISSSLYLPYYGRESEDFFEAQLNNSPRLEYVLLKDSWPETAETLILRYLHSDKTRYFVIQDLESSLKVTLPILKAAFDSWYYLGSSWTSVQGPPGFSIEEILSLPVPEDVWRVEDICYWAEGESSLVRWSRPDGSCFKCEFMDNSTQSSSIASSEDS